MRKFHGLYLKGKHNILVVSVHPTHKNRVKQAIELLPYVDKCWIRQRATQIHVFLSYLCTKDDLADLERVCREIVGEEDEANGDQEALVGESN